MAIDFACKAFKLQEVIKCGLSLTKAEFSVMIFLIRKKEFFSSTKISKEIGLELSTVQRTLKKLFEKKIITRSQRNLQNGGYIYIYQANNKKIIKNEIMEIVNKWVKKVDSELDEWKLN